MLQNDAKASEAAQDEPTIGSVFDFLYHDPRRVGSFLAQIDPSGHLTGLKQTEAADTASNLKFSGSASGSIVFARGSGAIEDQSSSSQRESLERTYDPIWTNSLALLDMLDERKMIHGVLSDARMGQFVKVTGTLAATDLSLIKDFWSVPALKSLFLGHTDNESAATASQSSQKRKVDRRNQNLPAAPQGSREMELGLALIGMLPHTIHARLTAGVKNVWCSLREDGLVVSASDLSLKYGANIPGSWTIVGVLDAFPDDPAGDVLLDKDVAAGTLIEGVVATLMPTIRGLLGRPASSYGITPLMIFRQVTG